MFPSSIFCIDGLARIIVRFLPKAQVTHWIVTTLLCEDNDPSVGLELLKWSRLLNPNIFYACCSKSEYVAALLKYHSSTTISQSFSSDDNVQLCLLRCEPHLSWFLIQFADILNIKPGSVTSSTDDKDNQTTYRSFMVWHILCHQAIDLLRELLKATKTQQQYEDTICSELSQYCASSITWTAPMLDFLCRLSPQVREKIVILFKKKNYEVADSNVFEVLYTHGLLHRGRDEQNYCEAKNQKTMVLLFRPEYPIHCKHSDSFVASLLRHHQNMSEETAIKLFKPLWFATTKHVRVSLPYKFFELFNPLKVFQELFLDSEDFLFQAIDRCCDNAVRYALEKFSFCEDVVNTCISKLLDLDCHKKRKLCTHDLISLCLARWSRIAHRTKQRLNNIMFETSDCRLFYILSSTKHLDLDVFHQWTEYDWCLLVQGPGDFAQHIMQVTQMWCKHRLILCNKALEHASYAIVTHLWDDIFDPAMLVPHATQLFCKKEFLLLRTITHLVDETVVHACYKHALSNIGTKSHFEFLDTNWPLDERVNNYLKNAIRSNNMEFVAFFYQKGKVSANNVASFLDKIDRYGHRTATFLRLVEYDFDLNSESFNIMDNISVQENTCQSSSDDDDDLLDTEPLYPPRQNDLTDRKQTISKIQNTTVSLTRKRDAICKIFNL